MGRGVTLNASGHNVTLSRQRLITWEFSVTTRPHMQVSIAPIPLPALREQILRNMMPDTKNRLLLYLPRLEAPDAVTTEQAIEGSYFLLASNQVFHISALRSSFQ